MNSPINILFAMVCTVGLFFSPIHANDVSADKDRIFIKCRSVAAAAFAPGTLAADGRFVYAAEKNGVVTAMEPNGLTPVWRSELGGESASNILALPSGPVIVTASADTKTATARALSPETGITVWQAALPFSERFYLSLMPSGMAVVSENGTARLLNAETGKLIWETELGSRISGVPAFSIEHIAAVTENKAVVIVSGETGAAVSRVELEIRPRSAGFISRDTYAVGDDRGHIMLFRIDGKDPIWKHKSGGAVTFATAAGNEVLAVSHDNFIYMIASYNGNVIWKRRLPGRVIDGVAMRNGVLAVPIYGERTVYFIDMKGRILTEAASDGTANQRPVFLSDSEAVVGRTGVLELYSSNGCEGK